MDPAPASSAAVATGGGGRFYKSRKSRPCDCCRRRKVACDMPSGPPCRRCSSRDLSCTFEHGPGERKRRQPLHQEVQTSPSMAGPWGEGIPPDMYFDDGTGFPGTNNGDANDLLLHDVELPDVIPPPASELNDPNDTYTPDIKGTSFSPRSRSHNSRPSDAYQSPETSSVASCLSSGPGGSSLELVPDAFSFYIGPTGAADVHLLQREEFDASNVTRPKLRGLKYRRLAEEHQGDLYSHPAIFGITDQALLKKAEPRVDGESLEKAWSDFWKIVDEDTAWRLLKLHNRFVEPYFPILASQQLPSNPDELSNMHLGLLAAICASALPFVVYDEGLYSLLLHPPSSQHLYQICWLDISQHLHSPSLATLQSCLLLQQRLPTNAYLSDTAFSWSLMSTAVAVAQTVGLHRDPMGWISVPLWERRLRKRLWWALWSMERWVALVRGMPNHIHDDDYDVSELTLEASGECHPHLYQLAQLSQILADIHKTYYTVRATAMISNDLQLSLDSARVLRARLKSWLDAAVPSFTFLSRQRHHEKETSRYGNLDGSSSIYLSYIVTHMTLFRALLRPLDRWHLISGESSNQRPEYLYDGAKAVVIGGLLCVKDFVEFLECLRDAQWNAFWHSWSRPNFAIAGSFMVHLLHITSASLHGSFPFSEEDRELRSLVKRWRIANRVSANGAAGARGLANLGLLRVETMLGRLMEPDKS